MRSYALEAVELPDAGSAALAAERLLERARAAATFAFQSRGVGIDVPFNGAGISGASLMVEKTVARAAIFRQPTQGRGRLLRTVSDDDCLTEVVTSCLSGGGWQ